MITIPLKSPLLQLPNTFRAFYGAFSGLHPIQEQAIGPVLENRDLIIQAATGSGKTEAVLAPCLEKVISSKLAETIIYIIPTRALAFDLRRRFATLLSERLGLSFAIRTGDVKSNAGGCPDLMLTTPESLDVMLGSANPELQAFLLRVRTIIIDEVHPFVHQYRGQQLVYLLHRLERRTGKTLQKIALSATIADPATVARFFNFKPDFKLLTDNISRQILPRLVHLKNDESDLINLVGDLSQEWKYRKILIFANSRGRCDKIFTLLNGQGQFKDVTELHYSNLNAKERLNVEQRFRSQSRSLCVATSTLELGIDVGDVDAVLLFEPPDSVSSFLQRIGRSNRRRKTIHFWGICQGPRAGKQLLRFLALLHLAEEGKVEAPLAKVLPSVLSQQIISCLYEKKRLSLGALQKLFSGFPEAGGELSDDLEQNLPLQDIFNSLIKKKWLKKAAIKGLYDGGWFYWDALVGHRIWSNFPENEEEYRLEVGNDSVADIPKSIVRQFEPGDCVLLAGRRLRILEIDEGECKKVRAEPTQQEAKELSWLGLGGQVSFEVAQAMRIVLKSSPDEERQADLGLFSRTRKLLRQELAADMRAVRLDNGIEIVREESGTYYYRTFIGSIGNLILAWSIREFYAEKIENLSVVSDEIGIFCSHQIKFEKLRLPLTDDDFSQWLERHFKVIRSLFPLNAFCTTLPNSLILRELNSFIRDYRVIVFFNRCRNHSSEIVAGDPANLDQQPQSAKKRARVIDLPNQVEPLLEWEKNRRKNSTSSTLASGKNLHYQIRALTGTMIGEYFRYQQCRRRFCCKFLPEPDQPHSKRSDHDHELTAQHLARGRQFEAEIIAHLKSQNKICAIAADDESSKSRRLKDRFTETIACLQQISPADIAASRYLYQPVLLVDNILSLPGQFFNQFDNNEIFLPGIGIPDLIQVVNATPVTPDMTPGTTAKTAKIYLQIGDIKSTLRPRYDQKWQVAFYAFLLDRLLADDPRLSRFKVANSGFLITPSPETGSEELDQRHDFTLQPYLDTFPAIWKNFHSSLTISPEKASWQLKQHCLNCSCFEFCYEQVLAEEELQLIPRLSSGNLQKLRSFGLQNFKRKPGTETDLSTATSLDELVKVSVQKDNLEGAIKALTLNKIILFKEQTDQFPSNISTTFVVHLFNAPASGLHLGLGLTIKNRGVEEETKVWLAATSTERAQIWQKFSNKLQERWQSATQNSRGPHIFLYGSRIRRDLLAWAETMDDQPMLALFRPDSDAPNCHFTDLSQLLINHFYLPLPGTMTIFALNRILGLMDEDTFATPASLIHGDYLPQDIFISPQDEGSDLRQGLKHHLNTTCHFIMKLGQWLTKNLESEWHKESWQIIPQNDFSWAQVCRKFIEAERLHQEKDLKNLAELPLTERMARFRALGPLKFTGTTLDGEGRFLFLFNLDEEVNGIAKFRPGDFLKLVPIGTANLQNGLPVIMNRYDVKEGQAALSFRQRRTPSLSNTLSYSLEEDAQGFHSDKLLGVVQSCFSDPDQQPVIDLLAGKLKGKQPSDQQFWLSNWLLSEAAPASLNRSQIAALTLPFQYDLSLISGPPGTGKTNLSGWILIALIRRAQSTGRGLRIAVSALTHQAIDQVLNKVVNIVNRYNLPDLPVRCIKWGRWEGAKFDPEKQDMQVESLTNAKEVFNSPYLIVGATGYGLHDLMTKSSRGSGNTGGNHSTRNNSGKPFDWVIFDEASQMLIPQALLSLVYGKGNFLFLGDVKQLPPIIRSSIFREDQVNTAAEKKKTVTNAENDAKIRNSILDFLLQHYPEQSRELNVTYRMNQDICRFPSQTWYQGRLHPAAGNAHSRLALAGRLGKSWFDQIIDPQKPVILVGANHLNCNQESVLEAVLISDLAHRLLHDYGIKHEQLAIISPHRAQNNAITGNLRKLLGEAADLPLIDTVERLQGAERDVIIFGFTSSDPDLVLQEFLNNPNRFNVAITRARKKLIVVGSKIFFEAIAQTENQLKNNACFKNFFEHCRKTDAYFEYDVDHR